MGQGTAVPRPPPRPGWEAPGDLLTRTALSAGCALRLGERDVELTCRPFNWSETAGWVRCRFSAAGDAASAHHLHERAQPIERIIHKRH